MKNAKSLPSRERVLKSARMDEEIDRPPRLFRADASVAKALMKAKGLKDICSLYDYYGIDTQHIGVAYNSVETKPCDMKDCHYDMFGNLHRTASNGTYSTDAIIKPVFGEIGDISRIEAFPFPDSGIVNVELSIKHAQNAAASGRAVVGGVWASLFTQSRALLGEERFLCALCDEPKLARALISRVTDMYISWNEAYLKACGKYIDIYYFGSDFGTQSSMFISREHYQKFFKENMRRIVESAKKYVGTAMFHTCGAVFDIIPDLIEIGVDMLDPVQADAFKMSPEVLSAKYKGKICFHGAVSTQTTLPFGKPEEVAAQVKNIVGALGPSGLVIGPDQDMIGEIPVENIDAMYFGV
ncbi:MAG: hypothetical protein FWG34_02185 [Oscillospiraceae bacterium]|nr:hypothetical protein [Oscillospiraceae bacterium]